MSVLELKALARKHWTKYLPNKVRELKAEGLLEDELHGVANLAQDEIELLVAIEPVMTATAQLAHYVLPPVLQYERADIPEPQLQRIYAGVPFAQYAPAIARPPAGHDLVEEWTVFWALAKRLGVPLLLANLSQQVYQMARAQGITSSSMNLMISSWLCFSPLGASATDQISFSCPGMTRRGVMLVRAEISQRRKFCTAL
jgi:hypothetical protein